MKKKSLSWWAMASCFVSLLSSVVAVCVAVWRSPELSFDYQGVIVGVLSLLVTVLIGWNIYSVIDLRGTKKKMDEMGKSLENEIKSATQNAELRLKIDVMEASDVMQAYHSTDLIEAMRVMFREYHRVKDDCSITRTLARGYILNILPRFAKGGEDETISDDFIKDLAPKISYEEAECFTHDFLFLPDERKSPRHGELSLLLRRLVSATPQRHRD